MNREDNSADLSVAIVGIACRFPGAANVSEFWNNLREGVDSVSDFSEEELRSFGIRQGIWKRSDFVRSAPVLDDFACFDASFFGYSPKEAALMDPQHRVFLECSWEALEAAGYIPDNCPQPCGVFAGTSLSSYLLYNLLPRLRNPHSDDSLQTMIGNDKDFLSTRVSYKLNLRGPSIDLQTGCSTSLVAVHMACQSLISYQCDLALAGGVSIQVPQRRGHIFQTGGVCSPDGRCRAFDAKGAGTIFGSGVGVVVLKRFLEAVRDRDHIIAVIKGSAVNNDGAAKLGYTAPSISGQSEVIQTAQLMSGVMARSIAYVECHGTATPLGDPAEITALTNAFRVSTDDVGFCAVGSVKSNIGHLDAAAGIAGLIKTALCLEHEELVPSVHYEQPNPEIDFAKTPFYVISTRRPWLRDSSGNLRRAGVSSFGIGGTNAHVILEEAPPQSREPATRDQHLLLLSAATPQSLESLTERYIRFLETHLDDNIADVCYTLQMGRHAHAWRRAVVCTNTEDAIASLLGGPNTWSITQETGRQNRTVAFMFSGGSAQYVRMGAGLYSSQPIFRQQFDICAEILRSWLDCDIATYLFPRERSPESVAAIRGTTLGLPSLFAVEYSLAKLWIEWGLRPSMMIGHSLGEYTAACLSGVLSLEDALGVVATRALLLGTLPASAMLSVPLSTDELAPYLDGSSITIAAVNGPAQTVLSGSTDVVENLVVRLREDDIETRRLQVPVAGHSPFIDPILKDFQHFVEKIDLKEPLIPYVSNLTGDWADASLISDKTYWVRHLREPVRFYDGMQQLLKKRPGILLEVGPGNVLTTLAQSILEPGGPQTALPSMRHPYDQESDETFLHRTAGRLWALGAIDNWPNFYHEKDRRRVPLPTYSFEKQIHWLEPLNNEIGDENIEENHVHDTSSCFYAPIWRSEPKVEFRLDGLPTNTKVVVFTTGSAVCEEVIRILQQSGCRVFSVCAGQEFSQRDENHFSLRPLDEEDYIRLVSCITEPEIDTDISLIHMWTLTSEEVIDRETVFRNVAEAGVASTGHFVRAIASRNDAQYKLHISLVSDRLYQVHDNDDVIPEKSLLMGITVVAPQEHQSVDCTLIDIGSGNDGASVAALSRWIVRSIFSRDGHKIIALRNSRRWSLDYSIARLQESNQRPLLKDGGVYLLLGGLGEIGLHIAKELFTKTRARLLIASRHDVPPAEKWDHQDFEQESSLAAGQLAGLRELKEMGADLTVVNVDVSDANSMHDLTQRIMNDYGALDGIFQLAGATGQGVVHLVMDGDAETAMKIGSAKVRGTRNIEMMALVLKPEFVVLFSSTAATLGGVGLSSYAAANAVLESTAAAQSIHSENVRWVSIAWDAWLTARYAAESSLPPDLREFALSPQEGLDALMQILERGIEGPVIVSLGNLRARIRRAHAPSHGAEGLVVHPSATIEPATNRAYVPPASQLEQTIASSWQDHLGIPRVGLDDKFFELGGNSLLALRIVSQLKRVLGREIPVTAVFEGGTVRRMAEVLAAPSTDGRYLDDSRARGAERRRRLEEQNQPGVLANGPVA